MLSLKSGLTHRHRISSTIALISFADLVDGVQRTKQSNKKCKVTHQLPFNTGALLDMLRGNKVFVQKAILRTYMDTIQRYFKKQDTIPVQFTATFTVPELGTNSSLTIFGGEEVVSVTADSSRWVELNLTSGLAELQSLSPKISTNVELTVSISVDCEDNKRVPVTLVDPATVPLNQRPRRLRLSKLQPMLLVFLSDEDLKTEIKQEAEPPPLGDNLDIQERARRESGGCHLEDFAVNFHNIDLTYVLAPFQYNARKCVGSCSHTILRYQGHLATNHAKIMASAIALKTFDPDTQFRTQPAEPCCVPTKYESISLLILDNLDRLSYAVYPTMRVAGCGCR